MIVTKPSWPCYQYYHGPLTQGLQISPPFVPLLKEMSDRVEVSAQAFSTGRNLANGITWYLHDPTLFIMIRSTLSSMTFEKGVIHNGLFPQARQI